MKDDKWKGKPRCDEALRDAEQQSCFYELFVPAGPGYLSHHINLCNDLANRTMIREHSLAFDNAEEKLHLQRMLESNPIGGLIDLPEPPTAINVEIYPDFPNYTAEELEQKRKKRLRWSQMKDDQWKRKPRCDEALRDAEQQSCFYELFVPAGPGYLSHHINLCNDLANRTMIREHSLAFDNAEEKLHLQRMLESNPIGGLIDLPEPPTAINVEIYPDFPNDTAEELEQKRKKCLRWSHGFVPIDRKNGKFRDKTI